MLDDIAEMLGGFIALALLVVVLATVAFYVSLVVVPLGLVGAGSLFFIHNIYLPEKRRRETQATIARLQAAASDSAPSWKEVKAHLQEHDITAPELHAIAKTLFKQEGLEPPAVPPLDNDPIKLGRYQTELERFVAHSDPDHYQVFLDHLTANLRAYQSEEQDQEQMFRSRRERSQAEIERLMLCWLNDDGLFGPLIDQLNQNYAAQNEVLPTACRFDDYAWRYLKDTPLLPLSDVDERVSLENRMYHTYLLGSSGSGKTNLLENIIAHDLGSGEDCCVVVIDSQTQLTDQLATLDIPQTTYITPKFDLALNLFDVGYDDLRGQGLAGETLINKTVGLLGFVLEGIMGTEFTNPQKTVFQYVIQLVISIPGGNINTFMDILAESGQERFAADIAKLDQNLQRFFTVDYPSPEYKRTREAIRRKLDSLLRNPTFRRLFSATENKIDMLSELERQKLIIIDTNKPMLDDAASAFFGRLFIAQIVRAAHQRFKAGQQHRPVYLIVDEAHEYFDKSVSDMLEQARKANIGLLVAHQSLSQARAGRGGSITDPLMVNTGTKLIWTSYRDDAAKFAGSMQIKPEDILSLPPFTFGMYSRQRGFVPVQGEKHALRGFPRREDRDELRTLMEARYGAAGTSDSGAKDTPPEPSPPNPDEPDVPPDVEVI